MFYIKLIKIELWPTPRNSAGILFWGRLHLLLYSKNIATLLDFTWNDHLFWGRNRWTFGRLIKASADLAMWIRVCPKMWYPLVNVYSLLLKMAIEIVDLPSYNMVIFHSYVSFPEGSPPKVSKGKCNARNDDQTWNLGIRWDTSFSDPCEIFPISMWFKVKPRAPSQFHQPVALRCNPKDPLDVRICSAISKCFKTS